MSSIARATMVSTGHTGNLVLPPNKHRNYLSIIMTSASATVEIGEGGGLIPLSNGQHYEPSVCPTSTISIVALGTYIVVEG